MIFFIYPNVDIWEYIVEGIKEDDVVCRPLNPNCSRWQLVLRKLFKNSSLPYRLLFGGQLIEELKSLKEGDSVLIPDYEEVCIYKAVADIVKDDVGKYMWMWNSIRPDAYKRMIKAFSLINKAGFDIYTFDSRDAIRFGQNHYHQFFRMEPYADDSNENKYGPNMNNSLIHWDFYFIGYEKNRGAIIAELEEKLNNYRTYFKIVHSPAEAIPYVQNMENVKHSKCIIEIIQEGQDGMTLRPLEAISLKKKLLTNNRSIKQYDFYSPENIFIMGEDDYSSIDGFINTPFKPIDERIVKKYDTSCWLSQFRNK